MSDVSVEELVARSIDLLEDEYDLQFIEYDDSLSDDNLIRHLASSDALHALQVPDEVNEQWEQQRFEVSFDIAERVLKDAYRELCGNEEMDTWWDEFRASDSLDEVRWAVEERDTSDPWRALVRNTPRKLVRVLLSDEFLSDEEEELVATIAGIAGIDLEINRVALEELVANGWSGHLYAIWATDVEQMLDGGYGIPTEVELEDFSLGLLNLMSGSGWVVDVKGTILVDLSENQIHLDAESRYGWQGTTGGVQVSAYEPAREKYTFNA